MTGPCRNPAGPRGAEVRARARRWAATALAALLVCVVGAGCSEPDRAGGGEAADPAGRDSAPAPGSPAASDSPAAPDSPASAEAPVAPPRGRPAIRRDTISIEGMPEPLTLRLYESPTGFPLPFSTYVPEEMAAERTGPGEIAFVAEFGGQRNENAALRVAVHPEGSPAPAARARARRAAERFGRPVAAVEPDHAWALREYRFRGPLYGRVLLGRHGGRFFHVARHYPAEYADGFGPRAARILAEWRWSDTGEPLEAG